MIHNIWPLMSREKDEVGEKMNCGWAWLQNGGGRNYSRTSVR